MTHGLSSYTPVEALRLPDCELQEGDAIWFAPCGLRVPWVANAPPWRLAPIEYTVLQDAHRRHHAHCSPVDAWMMRTTSFVAVGLPAIVSASCWHP